MAPPRGWPFFAPSQESAIDTALDLAELRPGERLVDLGCGEGHVLVAAARRGARVVGVECDRSLANTAQRALAKARLPGDVVVADLFHPSLYNGTYGEAAPGAAGTIAWPVEGDTGTVLFCYLSPAALQHLTPLIRPLPATRLVTVDFDVPDLVPDATHASARLYRLPGRWRRGRSVQPGWPAAGTLSIMPPDVNSLTCLEATHRGGPVDMMIRGGLERHATLAVGTDHTARGRPVAVDIRWRERPAGTLVQGTIQIDGLPSHQVTALFAEEDQGQWDLTSEGCRDLAARIRRRSLPRPTTAKELLEALGVETES